MAKQDTIVPRPTKEIDDVVGTPQEVIDARPGANEAPDLAQVVGEGVSRCMRDRQNLRSVEKSLDDWFSNLPKDKELRVNVLAQMRQQMETAKLATEVLYNRFRTASLTARN